MNAVDILNVAWVIFIIVCVFNLGPSDSPNSDTSEQ